MYDNEAFLAKDAHDRTGRAECACFPLIAYKRVAKWEHDPVAPRLARLAGVVSLLLWFGIVAAGRWIAYA